MIRDEAAIENPAEAGPWRVKFLEQVAPEDHVGVRVRILTRNPRFLIDEEVTDEWLESTQFLYGVRPFFDHEFFECDLALVFKHPSGLFAIPLC